MTYNKIIEHVVTFSYLVVTLYFVMTETELRSDTAFIGRVAANILRKKLRKTDKVWSSSLGVRRVCNNSLP